MIRIPDTSHTLVNTPDHVPARTITLLQLLPARIPQYHRLLEYLLRRHFPNAYRLVSTVHVVSSYHRMAARSRRDGDFDARVLLCEGGEVGLEELAAQEGRVSWLRWRRVRVEHTSCRHYCHASRSSGSRDACIAG